MNDIGFRIKSIRKEEGLNQTEFASKLFISQSYLSGLEKNTLQLTDKLKKLICYEFGINEDWLLFGKGEMYNDVHENDREQLSKVSNEALLKIMNLLSTKSNVEYGHYAYTINCVADILTLFYQINELNYLEEIEKLFANIHRLTVSLLASDSENKMNIKKRYSKIFEEYVNEILDIQQKKL